MIEYHTTASFDVDAQNTFTPLCPKELPVPEGHLIVPELNAQAAWARLRLGSKDAHHAKALWVADDRHPPLSPIQGYPNMDVYWPLHAVSGTFGFELLADLPSPANYDFFVWKGIESDMHPYGACYHDRAERLSTGVIEYLRSEGIRTVILGGLALDYCVKITAVQLVRASFRVIINLAATRGIAESTVAVALREMASLGVEWVPSSQLLSSVGS